MLIIKEKGEKKMRRKLIAGSLAAMTLLSVPVYASGAEGGESKYQTTYGSKQFDGVTISVELFDRSNAPEGSKKNKNSNIVNIISYSAYNFYRNILSRR